MKQALKDRIATVVHRRTSFSVFVALFLVCVFVLAACGGTSSPTPSGTSTKKGGNLKVGLIAEPTVLDPLTSVSLYDMDIMANTNDTLFKYDINNVIQPELVSTYQYSSPTVLNLTLHTGVQFHDGTPFNADAVIFNLNRFINDKASPRYSDVQTIDTVQKTSDNQVQITLKKPFGPLLDKLTGSVGMMLSPTAVKNMGSKLGNAPIGAGSGPFVFVEWIKGDHLLLKANPNYWKKDAQGNALPYLQSIRYQTITSAAVMYNNLETGQIQVASNIDPNNVEQAKANTSLTYRQIVGPGFQSFQLNVTSPPLDNVHVRRAIALAINRQEIVTTILKGVGFVAKGPLSPVAWAYDKNFTGYGYDPAQSKSELAQSGISNPSFTILVTSGNPTTLQEMQLLQAQLQQVGIGMQIKQETFTALLQDFQTFHYQAVFVGWTGGLDPDSTLYSMFTTKGGFNFTKDSNQQIDSLLEQGRTTVDQAQRIPVYQQAQELIVQDASRIFLTHPAVYQATTKTVQNYALLPSQVLDFSSVYVSS
ncbi:MAG TPA: ABC transporter substrate-binding protein [Ktedonosporobacter sp.]|nr:ABC transporter substrate-binding protein [Ktedonosporobacter sp.]